MSNRNVHLPNKVMDNFLFRLYINTLLNNLSIAASWALGPPTVRFYMENSYVPMPALVYININSK